MPLTPSTNALQLVLYAPDNRHIARLGTMLSGHAEIRWVDSREISARQLLEGTPDDAVVLLDYCGGNAAYSTDIARQLSSQQPGTSLIGVGTTGPEQANHLLAAVRSGVRDFIDIDNTTTQMLEVFERVGSTPTPTRNMAMPAPETKPSGRLVLLLGVRPGVGTSTLATHLGAMLAEQDPPVPENGQLHSWLLLLDLGQPSADAALYLGMESHFNYEQALHSVERLDRTFAGTAFAHHASGLALLGNASGTLLKKHEPGALLDRLRSVFALTLCDAGGLPIQLLPDALLRSATEIWLVADQAIGSLVSLDQTVRELDQRGQRDARLKLIVNHYDANGGLADTQIAQRFQLPLLATIPDRSRVLRSNAGLGRLLTEAAPRDPYLKALAPLQHLLDRRQGATAAPAPASPLARLANLLGK
ncbi:fimbrial protein [Stenotrophomonas sp. SY1]|uniref:AAA family ATPase n=1 Tax=Stenotrophomonas sp. SY1 TaxID=477235 RepID=UPI001E3D2EDF|nr:fimbrial protein [Stenotrophomonas sp. SY1]MCD9087414.1 fimbrial protein [Stenotrophomonas sp. SY1]